jgi:hypothetical protein
MQRALSLYPTLRTQTMQCSSQSPTTSVSLTFRQDKHSHTANTNDNIIFGDDTLTYATPYDQSTSNRITCVPVSSLASGPTTLLMILLANNSAARSLYGLTANGYRLMRQYCEKQITNCRDAESIITRCRACTHLMHARSPVLHEARHNTVR